jgi:hypothetical protein
MAVSVGMRLQSAHRSDRAPDTEHTDGRGPLTLMFDAARVLLDHAQAEPLRPAAIKQRNRQHNVRAFHMVRGQWVNTYLLRQHPCTPARDGIPTTNSCQHPCTPGQQRLTSECGVVSRGAINGDPSAFFARCIFLRVAKLRQLQALCAERLQAVA